MTLSNAGCGLLTTLAIATATSSAPLAILALALYVTFFSLGAGPGIAARRCRKSSLGIRGKAMSMAPGQPGAGDVGQCDVPVAEERAGAMWALATLFCAVLRQRDFPRRLAATNEKGSHLEEFRADSRDLSGEAARKEIELPASRSPEATPDVAPIAEAHGVEAPFRLPRTSRSRAAQRVRHPRPQRWRSARPRAARVAMAHRGAQRSAARPAQGKVTPAAVSRVLAAHGYVSDFVSRSHAVEREAHVATVAGDIVTPPSLRTRRTTYDKRAAPAP